MADLAPSADAPVSDEERLRRRAQIAGLEAHVGSLGPSERVNVEAATRHYFASGAYVRELAIDAGDVAFGKIHKTEHIAILLKGRVRITTEEGVKEMEAPQVMISPPGTKRVAFAITDTVWLAVHAVGEERDLEKIEARLIAKDFDDVALSAGGSVNVLG